MFKVNKVENLGDAPDRYEHYIEEIVKELKRFKKHGADRNDITAVYRTDLFFFVCHEDMPICQQVVQGNSPMTLNELTSFHNIALDSTKRELDGKEKVFVNLVPSELGFLELLFSSYGYLVYYAPSTNSVKELVQVNGKINRFDHLITSIHFNHSKRSANADKSSGSYKHLCSTGRMFNHYVIDVIYFKLEDFSFIFDCYQMLKKQQFKTIVISATNKETNFLTKVLSTLFDLGYDLHFNSFFYEEILPPFKNIQCYGSQCTIVATVSGSHRYV